jgi:hypothetical protein
VSARELGQASAPESTTHSFIFVRFSVHLNLFAGRCRERPALPARLNSEAYLTRVGGYESAQSKNNKSTLFALNTSALHGIAKGNISTFVLSLFHPSG